MIVCVFGPSGAGKTTLASIISVAASPRTQLVTGDAFIRRESTDWDGLAKKLSSGGAILFEHISAPEILNRLGLRSDLAIGLLSNRGDRLPSQPGATWPEYEHQLARAHEVADMVWEFDSAKAAILPTLEYFNKSRLFPNALSNFVIKIASRCNLNCSYCYMYQAHDQSWTSAPVAMSTETAELLGVRIKEHCQRNPRLHVSAIIHGGEPLSLPVEQFRDVILAMKRPLSGENVTFGVQTNGTRITDRYLSVLDELEMSIGISLDGVGALANRHRVYHSGASAYAEIERGIKQCQNYPFKKGAFSGVLCVVDPAANGGDSYRSLRALNLTSFDFLLRDEQCETERTPRLSAAKFLCDAYDAWLLDSSPCDVRMFKAAICLVVGANYGTDSLGLHPIDAIGVSTSGDWELLDVLRTTYRGAWKLPFNLRQHTIAAVVESAEFLSIFEKQYGLSDKCLGCRHIIPCGGGYLPHRYSQENAFENPSAHCEALMAFFDHVKASLLAMESNAIPSS